MIAESPQDGNALARGLFRIGVQPTIQARRAVVVARDVLSEGLREINSQMLRRRTPWLLVKASGTVGWVGPGFVPGRTGCWECLAHRLRENHWQDRAAKTVRSVTLKRAVTEVSRWLRLGRSCALEGRIQTVVNSIEISKLHVLTRRPQCPECGGGETPLSQRIHPQSRIKLPQSQRACSLLNTLKRLAPFESNLTGIVTHVPHKNRWKMFPVYLGLHCRPLPPDSTRQRRQLTPQSVAGKGTTLEEARASCLAEAIERYSIQWHGDAVRLTARESDLRGTACGLRSLALWSRRQLRERKRWNREVGGFNWIPEWREQNETEIDWTAVWSLTARRRKYGPTADCYRYYPGSPYFADSNGCASGNELEEAIVQGFLELVERDAVGIWWYNRLSRPAVLMDGPMHNKIKREFAARGRTLMFLDLTSDFEISVFAAVSARENGTGILIGTGAHLNPEVGVRRALGELCQLVETLDRRGNKHHGHLTTVEVALERWLRCENIRTHRYLVPSGEPKRLQALTDWSQPDLKDEIEWCVERARSLGLEVLVLDLTRGDLNFPVVRVIVPGMRHCWARLAPGRLYDVPVKLGWQKHALRETDLNPIAYFL